MALECQSDGPLLGRKGLRAPKRSLWAFPEHFSAAATLGPTGMLPDASRRVGWTIALLSLEETNKMRPLAAPPLKSNRARFCEFAEQSCSNHSQSHRSELGLTGQRGFWELLGLECVLHMGRKGQGAVTGPRVPQSPHLEDGLVIQLLAVFTRL